MRLLGIHDGHNAAACLYQDGRITHAIQEERITRTKNHDIFPAASIRWMLDDAKLTPSDLDGIALNGFHQPIHRDRATLIEATRWGGTMSPARLARRLARSTPLLGIWRANRKKERLAEAAAVGLPTEKVHFIEHHRCHAEAAYWGSPWRGEPVLVLTADGAGDDLCATVNKVDAQGKMTRIATVHESHSPALIYLMVTTILGMVPNEHEYKLMGMAPYAPTKQAEEAAAVFENMLEWESNTSLAWRRRSGVPNIYYCYDYLKAKLDLKRFDCICAGVQLFTERLLAQWVRRCIAATGIKKIALSGGIFMNVKANQIIMNLPEVQDMFIFPSCGDETNSMGAAFGLAVDLQSSPTSPTGPTRPTSPTINPVGPIYWGPASTDQEIQSALQAAATDFDFTKPADIADHAAAYLERGEVVARFSGRAEFGARALGNRSICGNPSHPGVIKQINDMIKSRDFWMPFACSLASDRAPDYLVNPKNIAAPYMILTFDSTDKVDQIAAGTHPYDKTVRPQVVHPDWNPEYYKLIKAFEKRTGIGGVLNTSFNLHGFPIVNSPEEALDVMRKSGLMNLILGDWFVTKKAGAASPKPERH